MTKGSNPQAVGLQTDALSIIYVYVFISFKKPEFGAIGLYHNNRRYFA